MTKIVWGITVTGEEIDAVIEKILKGGLQQGTFYEKAQLQHSGIAALFAIIEKKLEAIVITNGIKESIGIEDLIDRLMKVGLDVDVTQPPLGTLLIKAIGSDQLSLAEKLSPHTQRNINATYGDEGNTALILAAANGNALLLKRLLTHGADPTSRNLNGASAFMVGIFRRQVEAVNALLPYETTESLNQPDCSGRTALAIAADFKWVSLEWEIMKKGGTIPEMHITENMTPSEMRTNFLASLRQSEPIPDSTGMLRKLVVENGAADFPIGYMDYVFLNPDLRCLMILASYASDVYGSEFFFFDFKHNEALRFMPNAVGYSGYSQ